MIDLKGRKLKDLKGVQVRLTRAPSGAEWIARGGYVGQSGIIQGAKWLITGSSARLWLSVMYSNGLGSIVGYGYEFEEIEAKPVSAWIIKSLAEKWRKKAAGPCYISGYTALDECARELETVL